MVRRKPEKLMCLLYMNEQLSSFGNLLLLQIKLALRRRQCDRKEVFDLVNSLYPLKSYRTMSFFLLRFVVVLPGSPNKHEDNFIRYMRSSKKFRTFRKFKSKTCY